MSQTISLFTVFYILIFKLSLSGRAAGQTCIEDEITIRSIPQKPCEGNSVTVICGGLTGAIEFYRDGAMLYNGTSLAPELQSRNVSYTQLNRANNCLSVLLTFGTATQADTGNYSCRANATESNALRLVVESQVYQHNCLISAATGPIIERGENVTCSSNSGQPSWVNINPAASLVNTEIVSVTVLAFHSLNSTLLTTLECSVSSFPSSSCPSTMTSCFDRILVVPNPVDSYISLTPSSESITTGGSATFSCTTNLSGVKLVIAPLISSDVIHSTIRRYSDTNVQIAISNITMNFTEPIAQCMLQYNDRTAASAFASVMVLEAEKVITTVLPTTGHVSTLMITNRTDFTSLNSTPPVNEYTTDYLGTTGGSSETTPIVNEGGYLVFDTRLLIIGLMIGLLVFVAIIVLCALLFRHNARHKGEWTIASTSRRRGQVEVASSGIEGRLEWETDINPLVVFETTTIDAVTSDDDNHDDNGSLTHEDLEDTRVSMSNGHTKNIDETPLVLRFDAVIENHVAHDTEASSSPVDDKSGRSLTNKGYTHDYESVIFQHPDISDVRSKPMLDSEDIDDIRTDPADQQSIPNGHVVHGESDMDELVHDDAETEIDIASLNFIDATRLDVSESDKDWDSGYSLGQDSILSEIDEDAINIISV